MDKEQGRLDVAREMLLANAAFQRFAGGFEIYQRVWQDKNISDYNRELAQERMRDLFTPRETGNSEKHSVFLDKAFKVAGVRERVVNRENLSINREAELINSQALALCESGAFSKEQLAEMFAGASSDFLETALNEWNPKPKRDAGNREIINEIIAFHYLNDDGLTIDIIPTPVKNDLIEKMREGLSIVAQKMKEGSVAVKYVFLKSWLLGPTFEEKARSLLGNDIEFLSTDTESQEVLRVQYQALFYNNRSLEHYLLTGEKPEVRAVYMTREQFIEQFTK